MRTTFHYVDNKPAATDTVVVVPDLQREVYAALVRFEESMWRVPSRGRKIRGRRSLRWTPASGHRTLQSTADSTGEQR